MRIDVAHKCDIKAGVEADDPGSHERLDPPLRLFRDLRNYPGDQFSFDTLALDWWDDNFQSDPPRLGDFPYSGVAKIGLRRRSARWCAKFGSSPLNAK